VTTDADQRHPYAGHPAASVLADHIAAIGVRAPMSRAACECGWRGAVCDYPAHLAEVLHQAGLLKPAGPSPSLATCRHCHAAIRESPGAFGATWWRTDDGGLICGGGSGDAHEPAGLPADAACPHGTPLDEPHCQGCDDLRDGTETNEVSVSLPPVFPKLR
jgi:hypothetical protein